MSFSVEEPGLAEASFFDSDPVWPCVNGHEECSFRSGGPCWQYDCTCETTGNCMSCAPSRYVPVDRVDTRGVL